MRELLINGDKVFKIKIQDDDKVTFGPWSPPKEGGRDYNDAAGKRGTLRIYRGNKDNIIACFAGVTSFRDLSVEYSEKIAVEETTEVWRNDHQEYQQYREGKKVERWVNPDAPKALTAGKRGPGRPKKKRGPGRPRKNPVE